MALPSYEQILEYRTKMESFDLPELEVRVTEKSANPKYQDWQYNIDREVRDQKRQQQIIEVSNRIYSKDKRTIEIKKKEDGYWYPCNASSVPVKIYGPLGSADVPFEKVKIDKDSPPPLKLKIKYDQVLGENVVEEIFFEQSSKEVTDTQKILNKKITNSFKKNGDVWEIYYEQTQLPLIQHCIGLSYIEFLIKNPHKTFGIVELSNHVKGVNPEIIYSNFHISSDEQKLGYTISSVPEQEIEELRGTIKRTSDAVNKAIKIAYKKINKYSPALKIHLNRSIKTGSKIIYQPESEVNWS